MYVVIFSNFHDKITTPTELHASTEEKDINKAEIDD